MFYLKKPDLTDFGKHGRLTFTFSKTKQVIHVENNWQTVAALQFNSVDSPIGCVRVLVAANIALNR